MATDHSTNGHSPISHEPIPNIFHADNPEDVCKINPLIDKSPIETFARIESVLAMVQDVETWRAGAEDSNFGTYGQYGWDAVLAATRGALETQVDILTDRARKLAEGGQS